MKPKFAICDPDLILPNGKSYVREMDPEIVCTEYSRLELLMKAFREGTYHDFLLLDLGDEEIEACCELKAEDEELFVVLLVGELTAEKMALFSKGIAHGAQCVFGSTEKQFTSSMEIMLTRWEQRACYRDKMRQKRYYGVGDEIRAFVLREILYIQLAGRTLCIHTPNETFYYAGTIKKEAADLEELNFVRINQQCLVNISHIKSFQVNSVMLDNHEQLSVSKKERAKVKKAVKQYGMRYGV